MSDVLQEFGRRLNQSFQRQDGSHLIQLRDFFRISNNVYSDVLSLINQLSAGNLKPSGIKTSLPYIIVQQLDQYIQSCGTESEDLLSQTVRSNALELAIKKKNQTWIDIIVDVFDLKSIKSDKILEIVNNFLAEKKFFDASLIVVKFGITDHFDVQQILVPLLFQDKITVVDDYIRGNERTHGYQLIQFLDKCYVDRNYGHSMVSGIPDARTDKLQPKVLQKLVTRLLKQHGIDESSCPNIIGQRNTKQLRYLLFKKYQEVCHQFNDIFSYFNRYLFALKGGLSDGSWNEMVISSVAKDKQLQEELVHLIIGYGDFNEAFKWAEHFDVPVENRPFCIRDMTEVSQNTQNNSWDGWGEDDIQDIYYDLKLSIIEDIVWVNTESKFESFINQIIESSQIIGIDGEWPPVFGANSSGTQKLSILQIASEDLCHIIDVLKLNKSKLWTKFTENILNSQTILKLGFGIQTDLTLIKDSFSFEINFSPKKVLDLSKVMEYVLSEYTNLIDHSVIAEARRKDLKGLSKVVFLLLGKPLDKSEQFSDWNRRPLREEQVKYAALDSFCLLQVFNKLREIFVKNDYDFNEFVNNFLNGNLKKVNKRKLDESSDGKPDIQFPVTNVRNFRAVCDTMLQGLGRYLRICGADIEILESKDGHHRAARIAMEERRVLLTCGAPYEHFRTRLSDGMCYRVNNNCSAYEQMEAVLNRYNIRVTVEDLFTRCPKCNSNQFEHNSNQVMQDLYKTKDSKTRSGVSIKFEGFHISVFEKAHEFLVCSRCGQVFWDGCHQNRWKDKIKTILFPNLTEDNDRQSDEIVFLD